MFLFFFKTGHILIWSRKPLFWASPHIFAKPHIQVEKIQNKCLWIFNLGIVSHFDIARVSRMQYWNWCNIYRKDLLPNKILKFSQLFSEGKFVTEYLRKLKRSHESQKSMDQLKYRIFFDPMNTHDTLCLTS